MNLTVFGATGGIGRHLVLQALDGGHTVTAVVRDPARFDLRHPALQVSVVPSFGDDAAVAAAVRGSDTVLSGVGPRGRKSGPVASTATRAIVGAMHAEGVHRIVVVSATPVGPAPADDDLLNRRIVLPVISALLKDVYADLRAMEQVLADSAAKWTVVRPPKLVNKPLTGRYRTAVGVSVARGHTIGRADVAHAMLAAADDPATIHKALGVAY